MLSLLKASCAVFLAVFVIIPITSLHAAIERQKGRAWCWASTIQAVLAARGMRHSQSSIVAARYGQPYDMPIRNIGEIPGMLRRYGVGSRFLPRSLNFSELASVFKNGNLVIAEIMLPEGGTHAILFEGITSDGKIIVSDPGPGSTRPVSISELQSWGYHHSVIVPVKGTGSSSLPRPTPSNSERNNTQRSMMPQVPSGSSFSSFPRSNFSSSGQFSPHRTMGKVAWNSFPNRPVYCRNCQARSFGFPSFPSRRSFLPHFSGRRIIGRPMFR